MRTEEDLRAALTAREDLAPDPHAVLSAVRRRTARRRRGGTGAAAALTAAVAVTVAVAVAVPLIGGWRAGIAPDPDGTVPAVSASTGGYLATSPPRRNGPRPPFAFTLAPTTVAGFEIEPIAVNADTQIAAIRTPAGSQGRDRATLFVHEPGGKSLSPELAGAREVRVNGAPGWLSTRAGADSIRWEYVSGGWAAITAEGDSALAGQTLVELAEGVRFAEPYQVKVPYRLSFLPAGLKPFHAVRVTGGATGPRSVVQLEARGSGSADGRVLDITVHNGPAAARPDWRPTDTITGRPAQCTGLVDGRRCAVDFGEFTVDIGSGTLATAEVERIVAGMRFATWRDPATWYNLEAALPAG
jgi:hypothetical protein